MDGHVSRARRCPAPAAGRSSLAGCDMSPRPPDGPGHRRVDPHLPADAPAARSGSSTPTAGSTSRAWTGRPSRSGPSGSPAAPPMPRRRELLPRIVIKERRQARSACRIETERMSGIMIGAAFEVRYHVRAPKNAVINVTNTNGQVALTALDGKVRAHTTNGGVNGKSAHRRRRRAIDQRRRDHRRWPSVGDSISLRTTNGGVTLTLPGRAPRRTSPPRAPTAASTSRSLDKLDVSDKSRRRLEARLNGGGTPIELQTTNGGIRVRPRDASTSTESDDAETAEPLTGCSAGHAQDRDLPRERGQSHQISPAEASGEHHLAGPGACSCWRP